MNMARYTRPGTSQVASLLIGLLLLIPAVHGETAEKTGITVPKTRLPAPEFTLPDLSGKSVSLQQFQGKVILLNFWATWCAPCREEMPDMQLLWEDLRDQGFVILALSADRGHQDAVARFASQLQLDFPILLDPDGEVRNAYEVIALPQSYLIGRDGRFSHKLLGAINWRDPEVLSIIQELLR